MSSDEESVSGQEYESEEEVVSEDDAGVASEEEEAAPAKKRGRGKSKKEKKKKDPNKPKRNMSAFFLYSNANRGRVKAEHSGVAFGEIAKIMSQEFKSLPEKEVKKWEKKAEKDKIRYQTEMKDYVPPSDESDGEKPKGKGKKAKKEKKDPNKPKRNQSAFFLFSNAVRSEVRSSNPEAAFGDIAKLISVQFKALPEKERKKYDKLAEKDKARYQQEMEAYSG